MQNGCQNDLKIHEKSRKIRKKWEKGIWDHFGDFPNGFFQNPRSQKSPRGSQTHPISKIPPVGNLTRMKTKLLEGNLKEGNLKVEALREPRVMTDPNTLGATERARSFGRACWRSARPARETRASNHRFRVRNQHVLGQETRALCTRNGTCFVLRIAHVLPGKRARSGAYSV